MENGHDSPYLWVNWVMWLANTNGRKPLVFSLERSQQIIMCTLHSENMGSETLGYCAQLKKPLQKQLHIVMCPNCSAGKSVFPHFD